MARRNAKRSDPGTEWLVPLPLRDKHWQAIVAAMGLSTRQAEIAELIARGASLKEIATLLEISISTIRTQQDRIFDKTGTNGRSELLLHILDISHRVGCCACRHNC
jgi:DNA-binding CsgD family transcriptional regulator